MKTAIINHRKVSIKTFPYITEFSEEIIGVLSKGDRITVDNNRVYYDWKDRAFYKCETPLGIGYVCTELVDVMR